MELFSAHAEQSVLGALLLDNSHWWRIQGRVTESEFYREEHRAIFRTVAQLVEANKTADLLTVTDANKEIDFGYAARLAKDCIATNTEAHADIIRDRAQRREAMRIMTEAMGRLSQDIPVTEAIAKTQSELESIQRSGGQDMSFLDLLRSGIDAIEEAHARQKSGGVVGAPTGFPAIDKRTGGIYGPRLWVVAARPGVGKTAWANQVALYAAAHGHGVGICSLEMGDDELAVRSFAHKYQLNVTALAHGDDRTIEIFSAKMAQTSIKHYPIRVDTATFDLGGIVARITEWKRKHNISFAIVDHIGLIELETNATRNDQLGHISRTLKKLCKRLDMPVIAISQLNRNVEREKRHPKLSDLRDSGNIEQDVDIALFIHADDEEGPEIAIEFGLLKNRKGRKGWLPESFLFDGATQTFKEVYGGTA